MVTISAQAQLSSEAQFDLLRIEIAESLKSNDHNGFLRNLEQFEMLGGDIDPEILFFKAKSLQAIKKIPEAEVAVTNYINTVGAEGTYYTDALMLYREIQNTRAAPEPRTPKGSKIEENLSTQSTEQSEPDDPLSGKTNVGHVLRIDRDFNYVVLSLYQPLAPGKEVYIASVSNQPITANIARNSGSGNYSATLQNRALIGRVKSGGEVFID